MSKKYLSANTLFHFTNNLDNIINILKEEFSPRYCMESFKVIGGKEVELAVPMVCFCDIPLSQIRNHIENYGGYAIGLSKEWGVSKEINPVMYSTKESVSTKTIRKSLDNIIELERGGYTEGETLKKISKGSFLLSHFTFFIKPYEGQAWNKNKFDGANTRFYDEREWRYIPEYDFFTENKIRWYIEKEDFLNVNYRNEKNKKIAELSKLKFDPADIKYIIVNSEEEILTLCRQIEDIKGAKYSSNELNILKTRILSKEHILNDF